MTTSRTSLKNAKVTENDMKRLKNIRDEDIDYSDIPPLDGSFWDKTEVRMPSAPKEAVTMRLDKDIVDWFRAMGNEKIE